MNRFFKNYWMIVLAGVFFILAAFYHCYGVPSNVYWAYYNKTIRELLFIIILIKLTPTLNNTISILFSYSLISYRIGLNIFRLICVFISHGDYLYYRDLMNNGFFSIMFSFIILSILILIKLLNKR